MMVVSVGLVEICWLVLALGFLTALCLHRLTLTLPGHAERVLQDLIRYGKTKQRLKRPGVLRLFDLPKRWFSHFYAVSVLWNGLLIILSVRNVMFGEALPDFLTDALCLLTGRPKSVWNELQVNILVLLLLLWVHSLRRLLECLFVSVFSDGVIHVVQYAFGLSYYILLGLTVLCVEFPQPTNGSSTSSFSSLLTWYNAAGVQLFIWASLLQHRSLTLLASLRTSSSGKVETLAHRIPRGGWFELVSCPHYLAELLIYASLGVFCGCFSLTWWLVVFYVLCNQALAAKLCHEYYQSTFKGYPHQRKAFLPFLF
ncbi:polyprenol reductase [Astyanax mexicanus]|uniref:Polyprenal reductase n=1 Tax=Astyanax mexicanus TaxID=7994 RepID=A0A8T2MGN6_ASTMX|nr:polyprenol reductase [Astyanax mexicanus]KAG9282760.1 polyprenol reductase [Astyanax mexicanus]